MSPKLPPFSPSDPTIWFAQVEAQFLTKGIIQQAIQFASVIGSLQPEMAQDRSERDALLSCHVVFEASFVDIWKSLITNLLNVFSLLYRVQKLEVHKHSRFTMGSVLTKMILP